MRVERIENNIVVSGVRCFDLDLTLDCGQAFRWQRQEDSSYCGVAGGRFLHISKQDDNLIFENTTDEDFYGFWVDYFDLEKDYDEICQRLKSDTLLSSTIDEYYGIRILNQESWETLCSFVISQQNNIKRIKLIISRLCEKYGDELGNGYYTFRQLKDCRSFRLRILQNSAQDIEQSILNALQKPLPAVKLICRR